MINPESIFKLCNLIAGISWLVIIFFPNRSRIKNWVHQGVITTFLSFIYVVLLIVGFKGFSDGGFSSLASVGSLFRNDWLLLAGWVHYLAFDLIIGSQISIEMEHVQWPIKVACLFTTFLFGPAGWIFYRILSGKRRTNGKNNAL